MQDLKQIEETLPSRVLIAAGFNTYLAKKPEDVRDTMIKTWTGLCDVDPKSFDYRRLLSSVETTHVGVVNVFDGSSCQ